MEVTTIKSINDCKIKRVAAYARVSTLEEEQSYSYENQKGYYEKFIKANPKWEFAGIYADRGISGTTKYRPQFQKMLEDARARLIDLIVVKSVSRFARNAIDTQKIIHELTAINVEVYFEEQKISSFNRNTEMLLNMMATVAEHESRSISQNTRWAFKKMAENGVQHLGSNRVYGYDDVDHILVPNKDAEAVKLIYDMFANGYTYREISDELKERGMTPMKSSKPFTAGTLRGILRNEIYCGDRHILKTPKLDIFTKEIDTSIDYDSYYVENHHEAIVSKNAWNLVQDRLDKKQKLVDKNIYSNCKSHFLMGRICCGECKEQMRLITYGNKGKYRRVWKCADRIKGAKGKGCKNGVVDEEELYEAVTQFLGLDWNGIDKMQEEDYVSIKSIELYADGTLNIITDID